MINKKHDLKKILSAIFGKKEEPQKPQHNSSIQVITINPVQPAVSHPEYGKLMIHLDAGHGNNTQGKRSPSAATDKPFGNYTAEHLTIFEYEYNRLIVNRVSDRLNKMGFKTFIVTPELNDIGLTVRANRSNDMVAKNPGLEHIFISAHLNAIGDGVNWENDKSYWCAFTTKGQTQADKLAECFYDAAEEILPKYGKRISTDMSDNDKDKEENFTVLAKTKSPAVLIESLFMTNVNDVLFLKSEEGINAITDIYIKGIVKYFESYVA